MASIKEKTALVTGASSGIGKAAVERLLAEGAFVYAAARRTERMEDLAEKGAVILKLDVTDETSIKAAVESILKERKSVDILVNNAGYGSYGAIEDVPLEEARRQFDVNIFGPARLTQLVLPGMRKNRYGRIINISSIGGKIYSPFGGWYHATKHALEGLTDSLRLETAIHGIIPVIIEPGGIATEWGGIAAENLKKTSGGGAYADAARKSAGKMSAMYSSGRLTDPSIIAGVILKAVKARRPKTRYAAGYLAGTSLFLRRLLSDRMFDRAIAMVL